MSSGPSETKCPRCGLEYDYIPPGKRTWKVKNVRPIQAGVFARCGIAVTNDIQSGPIYCGHTATLMADSVDNPGGLAFSCAWHKEDFKRLEVK